MSDYSGTENLEVMAEAVKYNSFLVALIRHEMRPSQPVLDFGAGIGTFARAVSGHGCEIECVEPDARQRARIAAAGLRAWPDLGDVPNASVDLLYSFNVLEHIEDDVAALQTCHQKIKPGGRILIYVPAFQVLYSSMDKQVGHWRRYSRQELTAKVRQAGFEVLRCEYVDSAGFFASLLFKAFGNDQGTINRRALVAYDRYVFPLSRLADKVLGRVLGKNVVLVARRA